MFDDFDDYFDNNGLDTDNDLIDSGSDSFMDTVDLDLDGDGVTDVIQADYDNDGYINSVSVDTDANGVMDTIAMDTNADGVMDTIAMDTDADGLSDTMNTDINADGIIDIVSMDTNGDGLMDTTVTDSNSDGVADTIAMDTNADGLTDTIEMDVDADGITDVVSMDTNADGLMDTSVADTNSDGVADTIAIDTNADGIIDTATMDTDGDGTLDTVGIDTNGDGIMDIVTERETTNNDVEVDNEEATQPSNYTEGEYDQNGEYYPPTFIEAEDDEAIIGDPEESMDNWHMQEEADSCALVSQEFVLEELTGREYTEEQIIEIAEENGWYDGNGTAPMDVGKVLEHEGIEVERSWDSDISDIEDALENDECVIVGLDSDEIWTEDTDNLDLEDVYGIPGSGADHAVQVIGVDKSDPNNPIVILNDPGHPGGCGLAVPLSEFKDAWEDSGNFVCIAHK